MSNWILNWFWMLALSPVDTMHIAPDDHLVVTGKRNDLFAMISPQVSVFW